MNEAGIVGDEAIPARVDAAEGADLSGGALDEPAVSVVARLSTVLPQRTSAISATQTIAVASLACGYD